GGSDWFGPERHSHHILHVRDHQAVARQPVAIWQDFQIVTTDHAFGVSARGAGNRLEDHFDLAGDLLHLRKVLAYDLDTDRRAVAGVEHVHAGLNGHGPGIGHAWKLQRAVHLLDQAVQSDV